MRVLKDVISNFLVYTMRDSIVGELKIDSEYCVFWWSIYKVENHNEQEYYYTKWHCDSGPDSHLKIITYLNGFSEHGSDTSYLDFDTSVALKETDYLFNKLDDRTTDITPLYQYLDINYQPKSVEPDVGILLFLIRIN
ncbi:MAG: hypothetical protein ACI936_001309 [Paraglaciecola sp.]|jgi:hypothetical protein